MDDALVHKPHDPHAYFEGMYRKPSEDVPWDIDQPPLELRELLSTKTILPCRALDIGCGAGNYAVYLAGLGFTVTGVDFSQEALAIAGQRAVAAGVSCSFVCGSVSQLLSLHLGSFDFVLDYSILHHISHDTLHAYAAQYKEVLAPKGKMLLVCYSEKDEQAQGQRIAFGKFNNPFYYRTADEIESAFRPLKKIWYREARLGKRAHHVAHAFLFER